MRFVQGSKNQYSQWVGVVTLASSVQQPLESRESSCCWMGRFKHALDMMNIDWQCVASADCIMKRVPKETWYFPLFTGKAEQATWNNAASDQDGSLLEPSFVSVIENQTVSVGRDVILGCQVRNLGPNYKVTFFSSGSFWHQVPAQG